MNVLSSSRAQISGRNIVFSYHSTQTVLTTIGILSGEFTLTASGTISLDGSEISGTMHTVGVLNGAFFEASDVFVMFRL